MQSILKFAKSTKTCKRCGMLIKCTSDQDTLIHKRTCQPYLTLKSGKVVKHFHDKNQMALDGKIILSKKSKKILHSKKNQRLYNYTRDTFGGVEFLYSGILTFVNESFQILGCLFYDHIESKAIIRNLWVHHLQRRRKIATKLVDCLQLVLLSGKTNNILCSDLTEDGKNFFDVYFDFKIPVYLE
eukprot:NODE_10_length_61504_cov_0.956502.p40 type:complete len:185 gc:universal NODE_10_length_61504_cov_0.956502:6341-6895(+)